ncbi:MAG: hypothetical protein ACRBB4_11520 [Neptuniibacter sp.]
MLLIGNLPVSTGCESSSHPKPRIEFFKTLLKKPNNSETRTWFIPVVKRDYPSSPIGQPVGFLIRLECISIDLA